MPATLSRVWLSRCPVAGNRASVPGVESADALLTARLAAGDDHALAEAFDRQVTPHCAIEEPIGTITALHLVSSWPRGNLLELDHDPPICDYSKRFAIFRNPPAVDQEGYISVPQGPGLGVEINPDLVVA